MSKVFITQYTPRLAFREAEEYGEVIFLTREEYQPEPCHRGHNTAIQVEILNGLKDYIPGTDYIVVTGSAIPNLIAGAHLGNVGGTHKILKWSNRMQKYETFKI